MAPRGPRARVHGLIGAVSRAGGGVQVVDRMGTMDQPWNCPHGRPTMRHLHSLAAGGLHRPPPPPYMGPSVVR